MPALEDEGMGRPKLISLYTGAGGLDYGFEVAGFRTAVALDSGATVTFSVYDGNGSFLGSKTTTYPANYFVQDSFAGITGVATLPAAGQVQVGITYPGTAFVYSSIIDNRTSDSTFRLADVR